MALTKVKDSTVDTLSSVDINGGSVDAVTIGTNSACTECVVDNLNINGNTISSTSGNINITPVVGSNITLDGTVTVDAGVVAGATSITSTNFVGALDGVVGGVTPAAGTFTDLTASGTTIIATSTPASAAATGTAGTIAWDADYIYICTATDTWKRAAMDTWS